MRTGKAAAAGRKDDAKVSGKRKTAEAVNKSSAKRGKAGKDANKPKRPPSAFFVFMEEFRKTFQEKNPNNKQVSVVSKAGGSKWKSMSEAEKAPYISKAEKRKAEYEKNMAAYNKKQNEPEGSGGDAAEEEGDEGSDKSKSEIDDDDEGSDGEEGDDDE